MRIGGFLKQSLIDYPGKIASVIFTSGCNFRCFYCHNPELVSPELIQKMRQVDFKEILNYLNRNKDLLDAVVISGGEPTIHKDLLDIISQIKNMGLLVKLDTNGTNFEMIQKLLKEKLVNYIAMDIKAPLVLEKYCDIVGRGFSENDLNGILKTIGLIKASDIDFEFRTTLVKSVHSINDIQNMIDSLFGKYYLQQFSSENILTKNVQNEQAYSDEEILTFVKKYKIIDVKLR